MPGPMFPRGPLPPPRQRAISQPDAEVPESVYHALQGLEGAIKAQGQQTSAWQANHDSEHKELGETLAKAIASKRHDWVKIIGAIAAAIPMIVGGVRMTAATPPPSEIRPMKSLVEVRLEHECDPLPPGSQARYECTHRVIDETSAR